ncbi:MAG: hypothetical protein RBT59_01500 [Arcobacteraceae bacterium]|jgi:hypothetical protein|nr:hypothetical protein [Arcobacteraceae bacterium]
MGNTKKRSKKRSDLVKVLKAETLHRVCINLTYEQRKRLTSVENYLQLSTQEIMTRALMEFLERQRSFLVLDKMIKPRPYSKYDD